MKHNKSNKRKLINMCSDKNVINLHQSDNKKSKLTLPCSNNVNITNNEVKSKIRNNKFSEKMRTKATVENTPQEEFENKDKNEKYDIKTTEPYINNRSYNSQKKCTGSNNWEKFLIEQGKNYVVDKHPTKNNEKREPPKIKVKYGKITKVLGMDCEMVGTGEDGKDNLLARVSIVNVFGDCLYDKFVKPREKVTDYRTHVSGVRASDLKNGEDFDDVQKEVAALIKDKVLVGHAIKNDLEVLFLSHPRHKIRDTSKFFRKKGSSTPSLKNLALEYLNANIQSGEHSSVQDAQAAVQLYIMFQKQWESGGGNRKNNRIDSSANL